MSAFRLIIFFLVLSLVPLGSVCAQSGESEPLDYTFHVLLMDYNTYDITKGETGHSRFKFDTEGEVFHVSLISQTLSRAFSYKGMPTLIFFSEEGVDEEGMPIRVPIVSAQLGKPGTKIVVIIRGEENRYIANVMDIGPQFVKANQMRLINFSDHTVKGKIGDEEFLLGKLQGETISLNSKSGHPLYAMLVAATDGNKPYVVARRRVLMRKNDRKLVLFHYRRGNTSKVSFTEFVIPNSPQRVNNFSDKTPDKVEAVDMQGADGDDG